MALPDVIDVTEQWRPVVAKLVHDYEFYLSDIDVEQIKFVKTMAFKLRPYDARCHVVNVPLCYFVNAFYVIELIWPNCELFTPKQLQLVVLHEMLHIAPGGTDPESKSFMKVRNHDREDFLVIARKFGLDWNSPQRRDEFDGKGLV